MGEIIYRFSGTVEMQNSDPLALKQSSMISVDVEVDDPHNAEGEVLKKASKLNKEYCESEGEKWKVVDFAVQKGA